MAGCKEAQGRAVCRTPASLRQGQCNAGRQPSQLSSTLAQLLGVRGGARPLPAQHHCVRGVGPEQESKGKDTLLYIPSSAPTLWSAIPGTTQSPLMCAPRRRCQRRAKASTCEHTSCSSGRTYSPVKSRARWTRYRESHQEPARPRITCLFYTCLFYTFLHFVFTNEQIKM